MVTSSRAPRAVVTFVTPAEQQRVDALTGRGCVTVHRENLEQVLSDLRTHAVSAVIVSVSRYQQHYAAVNGEHVAVYPGVVEGLARLQAQGLPLAVLTNKPVAPARELLRLKGLDGFFTHVFGGDSFERNMGPKSPLGLPRGVNRLWNRGGLMYPQPVR